MSPGRAAALCLLVLLCGVPARAALDCAARPDLCGLTVVSEVAEADVQLAHDIVFLGDGFTSAELEAYRAAVAAYISALRNADPGRAIVPVDPGLFNFHRVEVVSGTSDLADTDTGDTALGATASGTALLTYDAAAALFAASVNAPDVDTVVLVVNSQAGRAVATLPTGHTTGGRVAVRLDEADTLFHELGHAIFGLADEYEVFTGCFAGTEGALVPFANLTADATGAKFSRAGTPSPVQGAHWWQQCIYRPAATCLLRSASASLCPVCARQVHLQLLERRSGDQEPPYAAFAAPRPGAVLRGVATLTGRAFDAFGVALLELRAGGDVAQASGGEVTLAWDTRRVPNGVHTLALRAVDAAGREAQASLRVSVDNPPDTRPPTVTLVSPPAGRVGAEVWVRAEATDDVGVARVELLLDGRALGEGPERSWDTRTVADGVHLLEAVAQDFAGNVGRSGLVEVLVRNDGTGPTVRLLAPGDGDVLRGSVRILVEATDPSGTGPIEVRLDGTLLGVGSELVWRSESVPDGAYTLSAQAADAWGNLSLPVSHRVVVRNAPGDGAPPPPASCGCSTAEGEGLLLLLMACLWLSWRPSRRSRPL